MLQSTTLQPFRYVPWSHAALISAQELLVSIDLLQAIMVPEPEQEYAQWMPH